MIRLVEPYIRFEEVQHELEQIFSSGILTKGPFVQQFTDSLKQYVGARHSFLTTSGTTALSTCLRLFNIQPSDEVIVSDFSFPATANVVEELGAKPIFADVDLDTFNMLPEELEKQITPKTKAVIFVDALGNPTGIHQIKQMCDHYQLPLIDDAACALGSSENGVKSGKIADLTCFSFHPRKLLTTGEGGAIITDNDRWSSWLERKLNHGAVPANGQLDFVDYGYNYRLPDIQALMGLKQLQKLDSIVKRRNQLKETYRQLLEPLGFTNQKIADHVIHNVQSAVFKIPEQVKLGSLIAYLREHKIESTFGTYCLSATSYYQRKYGQTKQNARYLQEHTLALPCHDQVKAEEVAAVIESYMNLL